MSELSKIDGIKQWQLLGFSEEESTQLYDLAEKYSEKMLHMSIDDVTLRLTATMSDVFKSGRDVDVFLNHIPQNKDVNSIIPQLKKRIKYCRNPMEKKKLQQELNMAYKEQKRGRNVKVQKETSSNLVRWIQKIMKNSD